ncbi:hypothetical protein NA56DRAFT_712646 [Hyaloscypha hepaticicola]|uniref:1-alkyl-2-acetylglycerophosphocholine esterase n=1 Tax=Hyaloscypha hepaticicola TaxID=2082293 RepID=A0A2J6PFV2_9HELO|nr:hypothetical protein NA56DRAFT_712646 [Hyaloscypha hepaticicola]
MLLFFALVALNSFKICSAAPPEMSQTQIHLPKPTGQYQVGRSVAELIDYSRKQPFVQDDEPIKLMISVFYPLPQQKHSTFAAYMPPETAAIEDFELGLTGLAAPNGTFEKLALHLAGNQTPENFTDVTTCQYPLVVFMPAEGTTRHFYNQIVSTIASTGYIVVSIDAAYDVDVVQYLDGSLALFNFTLWNTTDQALLNATGFLAIETRVRDVSFVLDSLSNATFAHSLIPNLPPSGLNTTHTAMFGHSLGGATAFSVLEADDRILGGLDMEGGLFGPGLLNGTSKPFMLMEREGHTRENAIDDPFLTLEKVWPHLTGWKRDIIVADTGHYDFSDYPVVFETLGVTPTNEIVLEHLGLGTLKGKRALEIVTTYVGAFLDFVIYGKCSAILDGPVERFPEVTFEY